MSHLTGNFNALLEGVLYVMADELTPDGAGINITKHLVTDKYLVIEKKCQDAVQQTNNLR